MWIMTQNRLRLVNTDQCTEIYIDKTGTKIYAEVTVDRDFVELGCYENKDACKKVLKAIVEHSTTGIHIYFIMPFGGEV